MSMHTDRPGPRSQHRHCWMQWNHVMLSEAIDVIEAIAGRRDRVRIFPLLVRFRSTRRDTSWLGYLSLTWFGSEINLRGQNENLFVSLFYSSTFCQSNCPSVRYVKAQTIWSTNWVKDNLSLSVLLQTGRILSLVLIPSLSVVGEILGRSECVLKLSAEVE